MNILTFDIEEWFHILDNQSTKTESEWRGLESRIHRNMDMIFNLLDKHNQKATFFCLGWVADKYPDVIKAIDDAGYEIGTHSDQHQLVYEQTPEEFESDLIQSITRIEQVIGKKVKLYRSPGFSITNEATWAFDILSEAGIEIDASVFPAPRSHGGIADFEVKEPCKLVTKSKRVLKEFPLNIYPIGPLKLVFSGGGYFRVLPYPLISQLTARSAYVMTYFHPRDFDSGQPIIKDLSLARKFKSYVGLKGALNKLDCLLAEHKFMDIKEADQMIDWAKVSTVEL